MTKMKSLIILFHTCISLVCAFYVPPGFLKLHCQDSAYIIDRIVDLSEGMQRTHTAEIRARSLNTQTEDLKTKKGNKIDDLILKDVESEGKSNVNERSFVYLKQKHRTPIINVVHGVHDGLGKTHLTGLNDYAQEFIKKPFQSYIDKFLKDSSFFNSDSNEVIDTRAKIDKGLARINTHQGYPRKENANELDKSIYDKLKIVELLKAPLVRCDHRRDKCGENRNEVYQQSLAIRNDLAEYPVHPTRNHQHIQRGYSYGTSADKETLCSHIYHSHIKDCLNRFFGKDTSDNVLKVLTKCIKDLK